MINESLLRAIWEMEIDCKKSLTIEAEDIEVVSSYAGVSKTGAVMLIGGYLGKTNSHTPQLLIPKGEAKQ